MHTSFRLKTGSTRKSYPSFRFVAASRNKSFHISVKSHNAEVKLFGLYQFAEAFNGIASCKIFFPPFMFHHFIINCISSMLLAALFARTQTSFGISQTVYLSSIIRNVYIEQILHTVHGSSFSHSVVCKVRNIIKELRRAAYCMQIPVM